MKRLSPFFIIVVAFSLLLGCQETPRTSGRGTDIDTTGPLLKPGFTYVWQVLDSLRTPKQQALAKKILTLTVEHIKVAGNRMVFDMSKDQFRRTGVPMEYFVLFKKSMKDNNRYNKKHDIKNVDEMMGKYRQNIRAMLT